MTTKIDQNTPVGPTGTEHPKNTALGRKRHKSVRHTLTPTDLGRRLVELERQQAAAAVELLRQGARLARLEDEYTALLAWSRARGWGG